MTRVRHFAPTHLSNVEQGIERGYHPETGSIDSRVHHRRRRSRSRVRRRESARSALGSARKAPKSALQAAPARKRCVRCDMVKGRKHFHRNAQLADGLHAYCKLCRKGPPPVAELPEGMSYVEIGDVLGCSRQNVWRIERRALEKARLAAEQLGVRLEELLA